MHFYNTINLLPKSMPHSDFILLDKEARNTGVSASIYKKLKLIGSELLYY
jgi:hypothetical protein